MITAEDIKSGAGIVTTILVGIAAAFAYLPKLINGRSKDKLDGKKIEVENSMVETLDERLERHERRFDIQDAKINAYAIKVTRLQVLLIKFENLVTQHGIPVPDHMRNELDKLTREEEHGEDHAASAH